MSGKKNVVHFESPPSGGEEEERIYGGKANETPQMSRDKNFFLKCGIQEPFVKVVDSMNVDSENNDTSNKSMKEIDLFVTSAQQPTQNIVLHGERKGERQLSNSDPSSSNRIQ